MCSWLVRRIDEAFALAAIELNLPLIIIVPKSVNWHKDLKTHPKFGRAQALYYEIILSYNQLTIIEFDNNPLNSENVFDQRNSVLVDTADKVYSFFLIETHGTQHCILKAKYKGIYQYNLFEIYK